MNFLKILPIIFIATLSSFSNAIAQVKKTNVTNYNTNPSIEKLIKKIIEYQREVRQVEQFGGARMNSITGYSSFDFPKITQNDIQFKISYQMNNIYGILDNKNVYTEIGSLKNFKFLNKYGAFNTKALVAEWRTKSRSSIGYFEIFIPDQEKNEILIRVSNNTYNWSYYRTLNFSDTRFQDIINELTIAGKPMDFKAEREKNGIEMLRIEDFDILDNTFSRRNFSEAKDFISKPGWRLPTIYELNLIYKNKSKNKLIENLIYSYKNNNDYTYFWSSSEGLKEQTAIALDFYDGVQFETNKTNKLNYILIKLFKERSKETLEKERIFEEEYRKKELIKLQEEERKKQLEADRLLREKKLKDSLEKVRIENEKLEKQLIDKYKVEVIGQPIEIKEYGFYVEVPGQPIKIEYENFYIAEFNFPDLLTYDEADKYCKRLGWRLPNEYEFLSIFNERKFNKIIKPKLKNGIYWTLKKENYYIAIEVIGKNAYKKIIKSKNEKLLVKAVKTK
jgi:hypothetical protein